MFVSEKEAGAEALPYVIVTFADGRKISLHLTLEGGSSAEAQAEKIRQAAQGDQSIGSVELVWRPTAAAESNSAPESGMNIIGKGLDEEERGKVNGSLERFRNEGLEQIPGELEKSPEFLLVIKKIEEYLNEELASMGLPSIEVDPRRIHLLGEKDMEEQLQAADLNGQYNPLKDRVVVKEAGSRLQKYKSTLHESVHRAAYRMFSANKEIKKIDTVRGGYLAANPSDEADHEHFRGLDEAVVDRIVSEILDGHKQELIDTLHITDEERQQPVRYYREYMGILSGIINKIAAQKDESADVVWKRFKKGEFTGEMMHLRDVEEAYGKGSLRILGALGSVTKNSLKEGDAADLILQYFETDDATRRDNIARRVLTEREYLRYRGR